LLGIYFMYVVFFNETNSVNANNLLLLMYVKLPLYILDIFV